MLSIRQRRSTWMIARAPGRRNEHGRARGTGRARLAARQARAGGAARASSAQRAGAARSRPAGQLALDPQRHVVAPRRNSKRQRAADNLLGDARFVPTVRRTPTLIDALAWDLGAPRSIVDVG